MIFKVKNISIILFLEFTSTRNQANVVFKNFIPVT